MQNLLEEIYKTQSVWKKENFSIKNNLFKNLENILLNSKEELAKVMVTEMHKPISQAIAEIEKCAWLCNYYCENAYQFLEPKIVKTDAHKSYVRYEPLGIILGIMPWNFPFWQVFRFAVPSIFAGNCVVVKHASNVPKCAETISEIFIKAGFKKNIYTNISISSKEIPKLIKQKHIKAVSLTGSEFAGKSVAKIAGKHLKKCVLELGGNNAFIVLSDANLENAVSIAVKARMQNNGQSCIAAKRFLIQDNIYEDFVALFTSKINQLKKGNPFLKETEISALAREDLAIEVEKQVKKSVEMGATLLVGGNRKNNFFEPTVLVNINKNMPVFKEEVFGPIACFMPFSSIDEAIEISNNSKYGLGVSIFTENVNAVLPYLSCFNEGAVFINEMVKSDPRLPFGGIKNSGYGRELAEEGIKEFLNCKTIYIK